MPASFETVSPIARYWLPAMSRKKSLLRLAPGANSAGASAVMPAEHLGQRLAHGPGGGAEMGGGQAALAGLLQVGELLQVLLRAEVAFELVDEAVQRAVQRALVLPSAWRNR